jgi:hypothetical protein
VQILEQTHRQERTLMLLTRLPIALGALTGAVALVAMVRLVAGAFGTALSPLIWAAILIVMVPWAAYAAWRARHGRLTGRGAAVVLVLNLVGVAVVWMFVFGPVLALVCSLAAFVVIWVHDWPPRRPQGGDRFVRFEELHADDSE